MHITDSPLKKIFVSLIIFLIIGYGLFNSRFLIQGPKIVVEQVNAQSNTIVTHDQTLTLTGFVEHSSFISINGRPITIDESGKFDEKLLLSSGMSIIDIYAKDKFGKETRRKIDVLYEGESMAVDYAQVTRDISRNASSTTSTSTDSSPSGTTNTDMAAVLLSSPDDSMATASGMHATNMTLSTQLDAGYTGGQGVTGTSTPTHASSTSSVLMSTMPPEQTPAES